MKRWLQLVCQVILTLAVSAGSAVAATEVAFGPNISVDEDAGVVWVQVKRTGNLSSSSVIMFYELWSDSRTTTGQSEILYNPAAAPSNVLSYSSSDRFVTVSFGPGESLVQIPYSISNDQVVETTERLYLELRYASTGTSIGDDSLYIRVYDNDAPPLSVGIYPGTITDEGQETRSFVVLSAPASNPVTLRVSTYYGTYHEANYPVQDDYDGIIDKLVTIPAGSDFAWVPVQTYQNPDPNDALYENFELCISSGSVSGANVNVPCAKLVIKDVPLPVPVEVASVVFNDSIGGGWTDTSWDISLDKQATGYGDTYGLKASYTRPWGGLSFSSEGFDTSGYDTLSFAVKGSTANSGTDAVVVAYQVNGSRQSRNLRDYVNDGTLLPNKWHVVHVPLSDLGARNTRVNQVVIESGTLGALFFDELSFLRYKGECE